MGPLEWEGGEGEHVNGNHTSEVAGVWTSSHSKLVN